MRDDTGATPLRITFLRALRASEELTNGYFSLRAAARAYWRPLCDVAAQEDTVEMMVPTILGLDDTAAPPGAAVGEIDSHVRNVDFAPLFLMADRLVIVTTVGRLRRTRTAVAVPYADVEALDDVTFVHRTTEFRGHVLTTALRRWSLLGMDPREFGVSQRAVWDDALVGRIRGTSRPVWDGLAFVGYDSVASS